ncbi:MAG: hypothetical protein ACRD5L_18090, partial [Bryobacteraceae bacterium]
MGTALLFLINAFVCRELFHAEYIRAFSSVEGSFIALSRWILENPRDLSWLPYWFEGMPWIDVYQPGFHVMVAGIAAAFRVSPALAYHSVNALVYCLAPVTFFLMCRSLAGSARYAFLAALLYSTFSASVAFPLVLRDIGGIFFSRRIQELTDYGDAPHLAVLVLLPLVILLLDRACRGGSRRGDGWRRSVAGRVHGHQLARDGWRGHGASRLSFGLWAKPVCMGTRRGCHGSGICTCVSLDSAVHLAESYR